MFHASIIDSIFTLALFINATLFIPQTIKIWRTKKTEELSLLTFCGFFGIQCAVILHAVLHHDHLLLIGYLTSMTCCASVILSILYFRFKVQHHTHQSLSADEILHQLPGHIYWKNKKGEILGSNQNTWKNIGFSSQSNYIGNTAYKHLSKNLADRIMANDSEVIETGEYMIIEEIGDIKHNEAVIPTPFLSHKAPLRNQAGKVVGVIGVSLDITEKKREEMLQQALFEKVISLMPGHVYWIDRAGHYLGCNDRHAQSSGFSHRRDVLCKHIKECPWHYHADLSPKTLHKLDQEIMFHEQPRTIEEHAQLQNGQKLILLSNKVPLRDSKSQVIGLLTVSIDITNIRKAEHDKQAAQMSNQIKSQFIANMSHDLRTPLAGIISLAESTSSLSIINPADAKEILHDIQLAGKQLMKMVDNILQMASIENMESTVKQTELLCLQQCLYEVASVMKPAILDKKLFCRFKVDQALQQGIYSNGKLIYHTLLNLLSNAIKFTQTGGITVKARWLAKKKRLSLSVCDTGVGIPKNKQKEIFNSFTRLTESCRGNYPGSGLGLYLVKKIIKQAHGTLSVTSEPGKGSTFTCIIPIKLAQPGEMG